jgi:hypothetical protein
VRVFAIVATIFVAVFAVPAGAMAQDVRPEQPPATPDPNFAGTFNGEQFDGQPALKKKCVYDANDAIEKQNYETEGWDASTNYERYPGSCVRMRFTYGPLIVKPGQMDVLIGPITIEKPVQDGYITRFKPNLTRADGSVPPVHEMHLHHATWLAATNNYGSGPFFASGEEKTIAPFPKGYGMPIKATDQWQLLYMVHSAVQAPDAVWITYEIDFVPESSAAGPAMKPALPLWLDVRPSSYPVFNTQRKYGDAMGTCTWPKEKCADFNHLGGTEVGQGEEGNGKGRDYTLPALGQSFGLDENFTGGTIIGLGGHLHPGGITNEVDLVRGEQSQRIYTGIPTYWKDGAPGEPGGRPDTWDFSMRVSGLPTWGVHVEPGDKLRSNATYDTTLASTWENMGIVVSLLVPEDDNGNKQAPGVDPFTAPVDNSDRCDSGGLKADPPTLCPNGLFETHSHYKENAYRGGPEGVWESAAAGLFARDTNEVAITDFIYTPGDLSTVATLGTPKVPLGTNLRFTNVDGPAVIHTITSCKFPCLGPTGGAFPLPDGETSQGRLVDFDSGQLGISVPEISGAKNELQWATPVTEAAGYKPGEIVTYFCRIHPSMRGAFEVKSSATKALTTTRTTTKVGGLLGGIR